MNYLCISFCQISIPHCNAIVILILKKNVFLFIPPQLSLTKSSKILESNKALNKVPRLQYYGDFCRNRKQTFIIITGSTTMVALVQKKHCDLLRVSIIYSTEITGLSFQYIHALTIWNGSIFSSGIRQTGLIEFHLWNFNLWNLVRSGTWTERSFKWNTVFSQFLEFWAILNTETQNVGPNFWKCQPEIDVFQLISNQNFRKLCRMENTPDITRQF